MEADVAQVMEIANVSKRKAKEALEETGWCAVMAIDWLYAHCI